MTARLGLLALALLSAISLAAESASPALTAGECLAAAEKLYSEGNYSEAAKRFAQLADDFGKSKDAEAAIRATRFRHAMCFVRAKDFAGASGAIATALAQDPPPPEAETQELRFWLGVARVEEKDFQGAREELEKFLAMFPSGAENDPAYVRKFPAAGKIFEARLLIGSAWLLEGKFPEAAAHFDGLKSGLVAENRSRGLILELHALLQAGRDAEAMRLLDDEAPRMEDVAQLITLQSLALELGNRRLEVGGFRDAIACLRRVWPADRLLKHQNQRLDDMRSRLRAAEADPNSDPHTKLLLGQTIQKVAREVESFQKIGNFDAALRFRLAAAYQGLGRHREAALILEDMLRRMPPDPVVEQASANLVRTWFEIGRWPKVSESAAGFREKFPASPSVPLAIYLDGLAAQKDLRFDAALAAFDEIAAKHPDSEFAPRAHFMKGFTLLLAEKYADAVRAFEKFPKAHPGHELAGSAAYWRGMGYSLDRKFDKARGAMDDYLKQFKDGPHAGSAVFRKAYCAQQAEDYATSIRELRAFLRAHPDHEESAEARILLGDALMNEGEMEEGIAALQGVPRERTRQREEAVFKIAKALKLMREDERLMRLMRDFQKENPASQRVAEAVFQIGSVHRQNDRPELARDAYWDAIREHGDNPAIRSVDDLFPALARLYRDEPDEFPRRLADLQKSAEASGKPVLAMRALWARAAALKKSDPDASRRLLLEAAKLADVQTTNPLLLADFAIALRDDGNPAASLAMFRDLLKWNPAAPQKDRALAAIGFAELEAGNESAALALFDRFASESPGSLETGRVLLAKAAIEEKRGRKAAARATLEALLAAPTSAGREKAEALFRIGQIHMADGKPELAIPYFQRIYVMHGRWHEWVAKAYLRSGEAFEKLGDTASAKKTYAELAKNDDLATRPEADAARKRLGNLEGAPK